VRERQIVFVAVIAALILRTMHDAGGVFAPTVDVAAGAGAGAGLGAAAGATGVPSSAGGSQLVSGVAGVRSQARSYVAILLAGGVAGLAVEVWPPLGLLGAGLLVASVGLHTASPRKPGEAGALGSVLSPDGKLTILGKTLGQWPTSSQGNLGAIGGN
jgi:hypothetical protein